MNSALLVGLFISATIFVAIGTMWLLDLSTEEAGDEPGAPAVVFVVNETRDHARVNLTQPNLTWAEFQVQMSETGEFWMAGDGNRTRGEPLVFTRIDNQSMIEEGDRILFCLESPNNTLDVEIRHRPTGVVVDAFRVSDVAACEPPEPPADERSQDEADHEAGEGEENGEEERNKTGEDPQT